LLQPGKSQTITFTLTGADLASFDTNSSSWIAEAGTYTVHIGSSSAKIRFSKPFTLAHDIVVEKDNKVLSPQVNINELKKQGSGESGFIYDLNNFSTIGQ
jgi:beta-glucosidase